MVTVMNSDGKPTQVPASSLNMSGALSAGVAGLTPSSSVAAGIYLKIELGLSIVKNAAWTMLLDIICIFLIKII